MPAENSSSLEKLKIIGYEKPDYSKEIDTFSVQYNPVKLDESFSIEYVEENVPNSTDRIQKYTSTSAKDLKMSITLDGTGAGGMVNSQGEPVNVLAEIAKFKKVTAQYIGDTHDVPYVSIIWGDFNFDGRLKSISISHTMFKADGLPVRSTIDAVFTSAKDAKRQAQEESASSPDLTHVRVVQTGDTLPLMCQRIYNDSSFYLKVARFNNLVDFRNLEPGSEIIFPPVV